MRIVAIFTYKMTIFFSFAHFHCVNLKERKVYFIFFYLKKKAQEKKMERDFLNNKRNTI